MVNFGLVAKKLYLCLFSFNGIHTLSGHSLTDQNQNTMKSRNRSFRTYLLMTSLFFVVFLAKLGKRIFNWNHRS